MKNINNTYNKLRKQPLHESEQKPPIQIFSKGKTLVSNETNEIKLKKLLKLYNYIMMFFKNE
jgi:hypothetical protein